LRSDSILRAAEEKIRSFGKWMGHFPAMVFGIAYLAAIPVFAGMYTLMPFDFYNNTARHEPMIRAQRQKYANILRQNFLAESPKMNGQPIRPDSTGQFPMFWIEPHPDGVRVVVLMVNETPGAAESDSFVRVELELNSASQIGSTNGLPWGDINSVRAVPVSVSVQNTDLAALFPCTHAKWFKNATCLAMTLEQFDDVMSLSLTENGLPTALQNSYPRNLYFSAATMSTLGYGDIVPISSRARMIVWRQLFFPFNDN